MRARWLSSRALLLHVALVVWFPGCLAAFWWQVHRAFGGNGLSYLYSIEWPAFALVGVWAWWQLVHTDPATVGRQAQRRLLAARTAAPASPPPPAPPAEGDAGARGPAAPDPPAAGAAPDPAGAPGAPRPPRHREDEDEALAAYNDRLARLAAKGPSTWRRP